MRMFYTRVLLCVHVTRPFRSVPENGISVNKGELSRLQGQCILFCIENGLLPSHLILSVARGVFVLIRLPSGKGFI